MTTYEYDEATASRLLGENPGSRWYKDGIDVEDVDGPFAAQRMRKPMFEPILGAPGFKIEPSDSLFAVGSCFARGIEAAMLHAGYDVKSCAPEFDEFETRVPGVTGLGFTNRYTTHAIRNELEWAFDPGRPFPEDCFVEIAPDEWVDPSNNPTLKWVDRAGTVSRRETMSDVTRRIAECRVVVFTLGLVELFWDAETGTYLNMSPIPAMSAACPGRYRFEVSDFAENRENVEVVGQLLEQHGHPDVQVIVTTSPVPLMATYTDRDVVVANAYSKAVLRAVAEDWAASRPNIHYFPSYEIVTNSDRGLAWAEDGRHVRGEVVGHIMRTFRSHFGG